MNAPIVSVIIPVHNAADTLVEQLDAVARSQEHAPDSEILIVDNRSTDGSDTIALDWARRNQVDLRVLRADERAGEPHARNVGLAAAAGDYVAYCDADDRVSPTWLSGLCDLLDRGAYATGPIDMHKMNPAWIADVRGASVTGRSQMLGVVPYAHGCNMGFDRETLVAVGGFDERYTAGCDLDIAIRMWEAGHVLQFGQDAGIEYRLRPSLRATYRQGVFYGRYRVPILARLANHSLPIPDRRASRLVWLARKLPIAVLHRPTRARWVWVAGQLRGEQLGSADEELVDLTQPAHVISEGTP